MQRSKRSTPLPEGPRGVTREVKHAYARHLRRERGASGAGSFPMASDANPGEPQVRPTGAPARFRATKTRLAPQGSRPPGPHQLTFGGWWRGPARAGLAGGASRLRLACGCRASRDGRCPELSRCRTARRKCSQESVAKWQAPPCVGNPFGFPPPSSHRQATVAVSPCITETDAGVATSPPLPAQLDLGEEEGWDGEWSFLGAPLGTGPTERVRVVVRGGACPRIVRRTRA